MNRATIESLENRLKAQTENKSFYSFQLGQLKSEVSRLSVLLETIDKDIANLKQDLRNEREGEIVNEVPPANIAAAVGSPDPVSVSLEGRDKADTRDPVARGVEILVSPDRNLIDAHKEISSINEAIQEFNDAVRAAVGDVIGFGETSTGVGVPGSSKAK